MSALGPRSTRAKRSWLNIDAEGMLIAVEDIRSHANRLGDRLRCRDRTILTDQWFVAQKKLRGRRE